MTESEIDEWKSKAEMKYEDEPFIYAVMQTCNYCGNCEHDMWGCKYYISRRGKKSNILSKRFRRI